MSPYVGMITVKPRLEQVKIVVIASSWESVPQCSWGEAVQVGRGEWGVVQYNGLAMEVRTGGTTLSIKIAIE